VPCSVPCALRHIIEDHLLPAFSVIAEMCIGKNDRACFGDVPSVGYGFYIARTVKVPDYDAF